MLNLLQTPEPDKPPEKPPTTPKVDLQAALQRFSDTTAWDAKTVSLAQHTAFITWLGITERNAPMEDGASKPVTEYVATLMSRRSREDWKKLLEHHTSIPSDINLDDYVRRDFVTTLLKSFLHSTA